MKKKKDNWWKRTPLWLRFGLVFAVSIAIINLYILFICRSDTCAFVLLISTFPLTLIGLAFNLEYPIGVPLLILTVLSWFIVGLIVGFIFISVKKLLKNKK